jgi:hypothetical protein
MDSDERAAALGKARAVTLINFIQAEAAKQNPGTGRMKVWIQAPGSRDERHAELDGKTVPLGEKFPNGLAWPGDPAGDPDELVGCQCLLDVI